ncbi:MAG TPA: hypothetical protein DIV86_06940, partial [Alphaproteobacteria bacterium]|nr:hypothetical protein [Alphaproteobacteria bacterium]
DQTYSGSGNRMNAQQNAAKQNAANNQAKFHDTKVQQKSEREEQEEEIDETQTFIPKEPVEPATSAINHRSERTENLERPGRVQPQHTSSVGGLFGSLFSRKPENDRQNNTEAEPHQVKPAKNQYEEDLEVPAFMRRKG